MHTSFTVDVVLSSDVVVHRDFWSPAARQAAAEARKRKASASAGRAAASSSYGRKDAGERISKAAEAHGATHGEDHGKIFKEAAAAHTKRIASRRKLATGAVKRTAKIGKKVGGQLVRSLMNSGEDTRLY